MRSKVTQPLHIPNEFGKVLIWRTEWLSYSETFIELQTRNLARFQGVRAGYTINSTGRDLGAFPILAQSKIVSTIQRLLLSRLGYSTSLRKLVRDSGVNAVHAHFGPDAISISKFCRRHSLPLLVTLHGYDVSAMATGKGRRIRVYRRRLSGMMKAASKIICVSDYILRLAISLGAPPEKTQVHYVGVEVPAKISPKRPGRDMLFVGRLVEKKGVEDLLSAIALLPDDLKNATLDVIGQGPLLSALEVRARELEINVNFLGAQDHADVLEAVSTSKIVVVPSKQSTGGDVEGLPTIVMEAMSRGIPVVGTCHSGIPEAIRHGVDGLLSPESDPVSLSKNLAHLLSDESEATAMGTAARSRAQSQFDISRQARSLDQIYEDALHGPRHASMPMDRKRSQT